MRGSYRELRGLWQSAFDFVKFRLWVRCIAVAGRRWSGRRVGSGHAEPLSMGTKRHEKAVGRDVTNLSQQIRTTPIREGEHTHIVCNRDQVLQVHVPLLDNS